jgi:hypothetical protein
MSEPVMVDCIGKEIRVGDMIVYPVRRKSELTLKSATVCERPGTRGLIKQGLICLNENGRRVVIEKPERCAIVSRWEDRNASV